MNARIAESASPAVRRLAALGQSSWMHFFRREWIDSGELEREAEAGGVLGVSTQTTLFDRGAMDDDAAVRGALAALRRAADALRCVYARSNRREGFVHVDASVASARDGARLEAEARELYQLVGRENIRIKFPATADAAPAIAALVRDGVPVDVQLHVLGESYAHVLARMLDGFEQRAFAGRDATRVACCATYSLSRIGVANEAMALRRGHAIDCGREPVVAETLLGRATFAHALRAQSAHAAAEASAPWIELRALGAPMPLLRWCAAGADPRFRDVVPASELAPRAACAAVAAA